MIRNKLGFLTALSLAFLSLLPPKVEAADSPSLIDLGNGVSISRIHPINLHEGVNIVPHFIPDGGDAIIFQAWRDNGNKHGYTDWMIAQQMPAGSKHSTNLVAIREDIDAIPHDTVYNDPYDGKHALKEVRFARAIINEQTKSVIIVASRDLQEDDKLEKPVPVNIAVYAIEPKAHSVGSTPFEFKEVGSILTQNSYCSPSLALSQLLYIPLPANYLSDRTTGCK